MAASQCSRGGQSRLQADDTLRLALGLPTGVLRCWPIATSPWCGAMAGSTSSGHDHREGTGQDDVGLWDAATIDGRAGKNFPNGDSGPLRHQPRLWWPFTTES